MVSVSVKIGSDSVLSWALTGNVDDAVRLRAAFGELMRSDRSNVAGQALYATLDRLITALQQRGVEIEDIPNG